MQARFGSVPEQFIELVREATELEIQHDNGTYLRIWGPADCISMDEGYGISERIRGAVPVGDDGGGRVLFFMQGKGGAGLYVVGFGDLDADDAKWVAPNLNELLINAVGVEVF